MKETEQTQAIAEWATRLIWEDLPPEVVAKAKSCLRDSMACMIGGSQSRSGRIVLEAIRSWGGPPEATLIGHTQKVPARNAAFANATMANALDFDDTLYGHPGSTTIPTALAAAEKWHASGQEFLLAMAVGYEISIRAMALMEPIIPRYRAMWDLGTLQAYGSAAAAARLAGLDADGLANALGLIAGTAPVPLPRKRRYPQEGRSVLKSAYGWTADSSLVAAELSQLGFGGPGHVLDDNLGFWRLRPVERLGIASFVDGLGEKWSILDVEFKPYMACRFLHPVLQGVEELSRRRSFSLQEVRRIQVSSFALLTDEHHYILEPVSETDAQFSVPYTVAAMIRDAGLRPESYSERSLRDPQLLDLAKRVSVDVDPDLEARYPSRLGARVQVELTDGHRDQVYIEHPKGSADQPLGETDLLEKFYALTTPVLGAAHAQELVTAIQKVDLFSDITDFTEQFRVYFRSTDE